jgi:hypothetical protein
VELFLSQFYTTSDSVLHYVIRYHLEPEEFVNATRLYYSVSDRRSFPSLPELVAFYRRRERQGQGHQLWLGQPFAWSRWADEGEEEAETEPDR